MIDYYEILEISPNTNADMLKKAYYEALEKYNPDKYHSRYKQYASQQCKRITEAYQVLADPAHRRKYDMRLSQSTRIAPSQSSKRAKTLMKILGVAFLVMVTLNFLKFLVLLPVAKVIVPSLLVILTAIFLYRHYKRQENSPHGGGGVKP